MARTTIEKVLPAESEETNFTGEAITGKETKPEATPETTKFRKASIAGRTLKVKLKKATFAAYEFPSVLYVWVYFSAGTSEIKVKSTIGAATFEHTYSGTATSWQKIAIYTARELETNYKKLEEENIEVVVEQLNTKESKIYEICAVVTTETEKVVWNNLLNRYESATASLEGKASFTGIATGYYILSISYIGSSGALLSFEEESKVTFVKLGEKTVETHTVQQYAVKSLGSTGTFIINGVTLSTTVYISLQSITEYVLSSPLDVGNTGNGTLTTAEITTSKTRSTNGDFVVASLLFIGTGTITFGSGYIGHEQVTSTGAFGVLFNGSPAENTEVVAKATYGTVTLWLGVASAVKVSATTGGTVISFLPMLI